MQNTPTHSLGKQTAPSAAERGQFVAAGDPPGIALPMAVGLVVLAVAAGLAHRLGSGTGDRVALAVIFAAAALAGGLVWLLRPRLGRRFGPWAFVVVDPDEGWLALYYSERDHRLGLPPGRKIDCADVHLLSGEGTLNLDGGQIMRWKRIRLAGQGFAETLRVDREHVHACFAGLAKACPRAVAIDYASNVRLPAAPDPGRQAAWVDEVAARLNRRARRLNTRALAWAVLALGALVAGVVGLAADPGAIAEDRSAARGAIFLVALIGIVLAVLGQVWRRARRGRRIRRALGFIRERAKAGDLHLSGGGLWIELPAAAARRRPVRKWLLVTLGCVLAAVVLTVIMLLFLP